MYRTTKIYSLDTDNTTDVVQIRLNGDGTFSVSVEGGEWSEPRRVSYLNDLVLMASAASRGGDDGAGAK